MNLVFVVLGSLGLLPLAAQITAVSLSGTAIAVMAAFNIVGDVSIGRRMFSAPGAYLYALTPAPRRQMLISSVTAMVVMDVVTMAVSIVSVVILSLNLASVYVGGDVFETFGILTSSPFYGLLEISPALPGYLLLLMMILFCEAMKKSVFYSKPAGGLLTGLLVVALIYVVSLSALLVAPFGTLTRFAVFFTVSVGPLGAGMYALVLLIQAAVLCVLTAKLLERKINI